MVNCYRGGGVNNLHSCRNLGGGRGATEETADLWPGDVDPSLSLGAVPSQC